ncbi:MAG: hypothetical protein Q7U63_09115 [Polaromonas sp.]|uniref:hypothetical protein n=1 Tax=Polaromonas sp. TaxID=1869339 RepID=UPI00272558C0|nr:hypothetical protein [Polaromonas sp.]MDO9113942.1 hypothetical protein [Polaromonas sp.]
MTATPDCHAESSYWRWLQNTVPLNDRLKWCHRTDAFALRDIIKNGGVVPRMCDVFKEPLTYLFYGRPAYRAQESQQVRLSARAPVIIIFNNSIERSGARLFPFDSGAFESKYSSWRHQDMQLSGFHMPCGQDAAERHVSEFFGSRSSYLAMEPSQPSRSYAGEFEVEAINEMLNDGSAEHADDRRLAIELQLNRNLTLTGADTAALVIPESISEAEWLLNWQAGPGAGVVVRTYQLRPLHTAGHYQAKLEEICAELV